MADAPAPAGGFFEKKWGPLPAWAWIGGAAVLAALGLWYYRQHQASTSSTATDTALAGQEGDTGNYDYGPSYAATQSEIQQLQGEESTTSTEASTAETTATTAENTAKGAQKTNKQQHDRIDNLRKAVNRDNKKKAPAKKKTAPKKAAPAKRTTTTARKKAPAKR